MLLRDYPPPPAIPLLLQAAQDLGFQMCSEPAVGNLLQTLVASKPGGYFLELGTGLGVGTAWLLAGMDAGARLITLEENLVLIEIAKKHLGDDPRVEFVVQDGGAWLESQNSAVLGFDLIFADTWPGKLTHLEQTLKLLNLGGFYLIDDLFPQPTWPENHQERVTDLIEQLRHWPGLVLTGLDWASGVILAVKQ